MFHVELRQFPHQARAFNLTREELNARILAPWVAGAAVELDDRRWLPERAKLTIYEGPELAPEDLGMGRGWGNVTRDGAEVTARLLDEVAHPPPVAELKRELLDRCADGAIPLHRLVDLAGERYPQARAPGTVRAGGMGATARKCSAPRASRRPGGAGRLAGLVAQLGDMELGRDNGRALVSTMAIPAPARQTVAGSRDVISPVRAPRVRQAPRRQLLPPGWRSAAPRRSSRSGTRAWSGTRGCARNRRSCPAGAPPCAATRCR